jgi:signal transduction histidine kinase
VSLDAEADARTRLRHDLHARLTVIVGYAELLRSRDDERVRQQAVERILEAAELLGRDIEALFASWELLAERSGDEPA